MAKIKHINCPRCGGTLGVNRMDRVVKCRYCSTWSLVEAAGHVPDYWVKPLLNEVQARRLVQSALRDKDMPEGLLKSTQFHSARLYFIPFHEMNGRRLGTMTVTEFKEQRSSLPREQSALSRKISPYSGMDASVHVGIREMKKPKEKHVDTRVVMSDLTRSDPAVRLDAWALEEADLASVRSEKDGMLQPMNRRAMERMGKIYDPTISPEQMVKQLSTRALTKNLQDETEFAEIKVKRVYYPVWRIRYQYQGRLYGASVDAVTGKIMTLRAPQDDRSRVLWLLGTTSLVAFILGRMIFAILHLTMIDQAHYGVIIHALARMSVAVIPVFLVGLLLATIVLGFGWEQFRYPGDVIIRGRKKTIEKIARPDQTAFDKLATTLSNILGDTFTMRVKERDLFS